MPQETLDNISFDQTDIDWVLTRFGVYEQAAQIGGREIGEESLNLLQDEARNFFDVLRGHEINRVEGEAQGLAGKYHYRLNKAIPAIFEFIVVEAAAVAVAAVTPPVGVALSLIGPGAAVMGKWREIITPLDHEELLVLSTITDLIKADYRILREEGVTEEDIERALDKKGLAVPDLHGCLERLSGDVGEKKVVVKTRGSGGILRYTPIR